MLSFPCVPELKVAYVWQESINHKSFINGENLNNKIQAHVCLYTEKTRETASTWVAE